MKKISVIFSGMAGGGKTSLAKEIAKRHGLKYICGGDALKEIAGHRGYKVTGSDWWETKDGMNFLAERKANADFDKEVDKVLLSKAKEGGVSITSWALPWLGASGIKIWVDTSQEVRAGRIASRDKIPLSQALEAVKKRDAENILLYKKMYGYDFQKDPKIFDLIIDANTKSVKELADEIDDFLEEKFRP